MLQRGTEAQGGPSSPSEGQCGLGWGGGVM